MKSTSYFNLFLLLFFLACAKSTPTLNEFDFNSWIADKKGCLGKRLSMKKTIDDQKKKLLGLSEAQVVELLGSPDHNELYKRNQKFYYYFIQPAPECSNASSKDSEELVIRFNAIGLSNDVTIE